VFLFVYFTKKGSSNKLKKLISLVFFRKKTTCIRIEKRLCAKTNEGIPTFCVPSLEKDTKTFLTLLFSVYANTGCARTNARVYANTGTKASHTSCEALLLVSLIEDFKQPSCIPCFTP